MAHSHRSTLKQENKGFKSKHASKGAIKKSLKGRVNSKNPSVHASSLTKIARKNASRVAQKAKREVNCDKGAIYKGINAMSKIVTVVGLCPDVDCDSVIQALLDSESGEASTMETSELQMQSNEGMQEKTDQESNKLNMGTRTITLTRFKQRLSFVVTKPDLLDILEGVRISDTVLFVLSANEEVDAFGEHVMATIKSQGVPNVVCMVQHLESHPAKHQLAVRSSLLYYMTHHFPNEEKLFSSGNRSECTSALRHLCTQQIKGINWRDRHAYMVAESLSLTENADESVDAEEMNGGPKTGTLKVTGFIRGNKLSANRLVHIPTFGDFQIGRIIASPLARHAKRNQDTEMATEEVLHEADPEFRETLVAENEIDPLDAEQTWPTEDELRDAEGTTN
jgi:pre-rRNA-processing protein TSR1